MILSFFNLKAQNLSMGDLLQIRKMNIGAADDFLTSKGWEFSDAEEQSEGELASVGWTYNNNINKKINNSNLYIYFSEFDKNNVQENRIYLFLNDKIKYFEYLNAIKNYDCKLIETEIKNGRLKKVYSSNTITFEIESSVIEDSIGNNLLSWTILILSNYDYLMNFSNQLNEINSNKIENSNNQIDLSLDTILIHEKQKNIYWELEKPAEFPGGISSFASYLQENLKYPIKAQKNKVEGKVYIQFVVNIDGSLSDFKVLKSVGSGCDEEAIRVIKNGPNWKPGTLSGKLVRTRFTQPITFQLTK